MVWCPFRDFPPGVVIIGFGNEIGRVIGAFLLILLAFAVIASFIPTIMRSVALQVAILLLFIAGCLGYFFIYVWPKHKLTFPK